MNSNMKMTVERSKRLSYFLSLVFITKSDIATSFTIMLVMYACAALSEVILMNSVFWN